MAHRPYTQTLAAELMRVALRTFIAQGFNYEDLNEFVLEVTSEIGEGDE